MIYTLKVKSIQHYYGNHGKTIDGNHSSGSHPNEDIKVIKKDEVRDHLYTLLLSMIVVQQLNRTENRVCAIILANSRLLTYNWLIQLLI